MLLNENELRSIRLTTTPDGKVVPEIIDQTCLPHELRLVTLETVDDVARAIREMWVRGAPLIGATAAYGVALGSRLDATDAGLRAAAETLLETRPTAVNLRWAVEDMLDRLTPVPTPDRERVAFQHASALAEQDAEICRSLGEHGARVLADLAGAGGASGTVQVLTHCNAGWLATVDWGTALAPVYRAHRDGLPLHVWVSETRPRNQGAGLTAWELSQEEVPHTVIADNAAGHLLRTGQVDVVITGTDRTTASGDVCNKIGTYLKAVAARDCGVPFYVAVPGPSIDWTLGPGQAGEIPIEERDGKEVTEVRGISSEGQWLSVRVTPAGSAVANYGFDVTPARLVSGLITERGVCPASAEGLLALYPERSLNKPGDRADTSTGGPSA